MGMIKHSQITQSNRFAISLQYLKKEARNGDQFWHADKRHSFYNSVLFFLMEVARHVQNTQNRKLVIFLRYIEKNCRDCFLFYCVAKHSNILRGSSHVRCYLLMFKVGGIIGISKIKFFSFPKLKGLNEIKKIKNIKNLLSL